MTTDHDLLAKIDGNQNTLITVEKIEELQHFLFSEVKTTRFVSMLEGWKLYQVEQIAKKDKALRAVVELHKPREREITPTPNDPFWYKVECSHCIEHETQAGWIYAKFPCPTIQAITEQLK